MAAGATYEPIATVSPSSTNTITFNSFSGYTDLKIILNSIGTSAGQQALLRFNSDTASNYSFTYIYGSGSAAGSGRQSSTTYIFGETGGVSTTIPHLSIIDIFSYSGSTNKTCLWQCAEDSNGSGFVVRTVGLWRSTSAITSLTLSMGNNFASGTTATLYGIKAA